MRVDDNGIRAIALAAALQAIPAGRAPVQCAPTNDSASPKYSDAKTSRRQYESYDKAKSTTYEDFEEPLYSASIVKWI